jgi:hypothetical protein
MRLRTILLMIPLSIFGYIFYQMFLITGEDMLGMHYKLIPRLVLSFLDTVIIAYPLDFFRVGLAVIFNWVMLILLCAVLFGISLLLFQCNPFIPF